MSSISASNYLETDILDTVLMGGAIAYPILTSTSGLSARSSSDIHTTMFVEFAVGTVTWALALKEAQVAEDHTPRVVVV